VVGRDRVDELRLALRELSLEGGEVHPRAVHRDAHDLEAVVAEDLERIRIARLLHEGDVARTREAAADEIERLGDAAGQHQGIRVDRRAALRAEEAGERVAEAGVALALPVVQVEGRGVGEEALVAAGEEPERQQVGRGLADAEVDRAALRSAVEGRGDAHDATAGITRRNTSCGRSSRNAVMFVAEMRRRSSSAVSE
jgi:hypothetical protein